MQMPRFFLSLFARIPKDRGLLKDAEQLAFGWGLGSNILSH